MSRNLKEVRVLAVGEDSSRHKNNQCKGPEVGKCLRSSAEAPVG